MALIRAVMAVLAALKVSLAAHARSVRVVSATVLAGLAMIWSAIANQAAPARSCRSMRPRMLGGAYRRMRASSESK